MFKGDLFTVWNISRVIYRKQEENSYIHSLDWIKPVAGLFHLQMILLNLMFDKFWRNSGNVFSLRQFSTALPGRSSITIKAKDYQYNDDFFYTVV